MNNKTDIFDEYTVAANPPSALIINANPGEHSSLGATDKVVDDVAPRPLFNGRQPAYVLKAERPEHRAIIMLKAAGRTNVEIAEATGTTTVHVATIVKQPWAVTQILKEIEGAGREPVIELMQGAAFDAATRLIEIANVAKNEETKRKANLDVLQFSFGKPNQPITSTLTIAPSTMSEKQIDAELAKAYAERAN